MTRLGALIAVLACATLSAQTPLPLVELTTEQDHRRMLDLLGIASLRPGPSGNPKAPNAANADESKANPYPVLPDPLKFEDGTPVRTAADWKKRRVEIIDLFDREVYGRTPAATPKVTWYVTSTIDEDIDGIPAVTRALTGRVDSSAYPAITVELQARLTLAKSAKGPAPVMLTFGFGPRPPGFPAFPQAPGPSWQQQVLSKGWGYVVYVPTSSQADNGAGLTRGIIGLVNKGQPRSLDDWGALKAWAWGASRVLDYLETNPAVDSRRVGLEGLSRYGKAVAVAMAYDERFAVAFIGSSGAGGVKLHRRHFGEQVENVAGSGEYHWMGGRYIKYAGPLTPNDLPVDSHQLVALCAPRPVYVSSGSLAVEGGWIDAKGMFMAAAAAGPVYRLLGKKDLGTTEFPPEKTGLLDGDIAWRQHEGGHTTGPNWPTFLKWADRYIGKPSP